MSNAYRVAHERMANSANWDRIDKFLADLTDADLTDLKDEAIRSAKISDGAKVMFAAMDPRTRKSLQVLIYEYFMKTAHAR